ncbi:MAG: GNAT family N-acetyltransferase [Chloroflexota bacterium]|nr:MAG: N-acetyltransferase [Chloroflexota bacterium]
MLVTTQASSAPPLAIDIRPARMDDIYPILRLHREAFADKFGAAFGANGAARGIEAMAEAWRRQGISALRGMIVAVADGEVIGTISLRTWEMGNDSSGAAELAFHQVLGIWGALRSIFALSLLDHQIERGEGYITDVAVHGRYRRRGVARALLARAEEDARLRNKRYLGLYVSAANSAARRLYTRAGFAERQVRRSWLAGWVLRQHKWIYMRKDLTE